jgi:hypothetical protein
MNNSSFLNDDIFELLKYCTTNNRKKLAEKIKDHTIEKKNIISFFNIIFLMRNCIDIKTSFCGIYSSIKYYDINDHIIECDKNEMFDHSLNDIIIKVIINNKLLKFYRNECNIINNIFINSIGKVGHLSIIEHSKIVKKDNKYDYLLNVIKTSESILKTYNDTRLKNDKLFYGNIVGMKLQKLINYFGENMLRSIKCNIVNKTNLSKMSYYTKYNHFLYTLQYITRILSNCKNIIKLYNHNIKKDNNNIIVFEISKQ